MEERERTSLARNSGLRERLLRFGAARDSRLSSHAPRSRLYALLSKVPAQWLKTALSGVLSLFFGLMAWDLSERNAEIRFREGTSPDAQLTHPLLSGLGLNPIPDIAEKQRLLLRLTPRTFSSAERGKISMLSFLSDDGACVALLRDSGEESLENFELYCDPTRGERNKSGKRTLPKRWISQGPGWSGLEGLLTALKLRPKTASVSPRMGSPHHRARDPRALQF